MNDMTQSNFSYFRKAVTRAVSNYSISAKDLYFSQSQRGYYADYRPAYPDKTPADFTVYQDMDETVRVYGNPDALVPTIDTFTDLADFEVNL